MLSFFTTGFAALLALQAPAETPASKPARLLDNVAVVGASVSAGYRAEMRFADVLAASLTAPPATPFADKATEMLFLKPGASAKRQLDHVVKTQPTLIVALDLPFWFGYGSVDFDGQPLGGEEARLPLLERGLELFATVETTLVIGDFPDMSHAVGRMLMPDQVPKPETLTALNKRLREWAAQRKNVVLLPMSSWVAELRAQKPITLGSKTFAPDVTATWTHADGLHPTKAGLAVLACVVHTELLARKLVEPSEVLLDPTAILERAIAAKPAEAGAPAPDDKPVK